MPGLFRVSRSPEYHSRTQSPSYARCYEGLWPNPYSELASDWLVLTPDIVFLPCFYGIRLWIWPEPLVAPRARRALGTRMTWIYVTFLSFSIYHTICDGGDANRQFINIHFNSCHPSDLHFIGYNVWTPEVLMIFMMDCKVRVSFTNIKH